MARQQQRLNRLEAVEAPPIDEETLLASKLLNTLETWSAERTLLPDGDDSTPEQVAKACKGLAEQVHSGDVEFSLSAMISLTPDAVFHTIEVEATRIYGDDF